MKFLLPTLLAVFLTACSSSPLRPAAPVSMGAFQESRQIQRNGSMSITSRSLKESSEKSLALAAQHQALISSSKLTEDHFQAKIRVPAPSLNSLMNSLGTVGKVTSKRVEMSDITEAYFDLQAALQNKRALRDRLRSLLSRATKVEDILKIEKELSRVQTELDQMEARMKSMQSKVALSTLDFSIDRDRVPGPLGVVKKGSGWALGKLFYLN